MAKDFSAGKSASMIKSVASKSKEENGKKTIRNIGVDSIDMSEDNNKVFNCDDLDNLVSAIKRNGFQGAVEVFLKKDGRYGLLSGHRRFMASKLAGLTEIPCEIMEEPTEVQKAEILIMSNIASRRLSPLELGRSIVYYEENVLKKDKSFKGDKRSELAKRFGISSSQVHKMKALVDLIPDLQSLVDEGKVPYASVYSCASLDADIQLLIANAIKDTLTEFELENLSGREVASIIENFTSPKGGSVNETASVKDVVSSVGSASESDNSDGDDAEEDFSMPAPETKEEFKKSEEVVSFENKKAEESLNEKRLMSYSRDFRKLIGDMSANKPLKIKDNDVLAELKALKELLNKINF